MLQANRRPQTHELRAIPNGADGTRATLDIMRQFVRRYKKSLALRNLALSVVEPVLQGTRKNYAAQVRAIHSFVQNHINYVQDINGVETLATPLRTLEMRKGDCDDQAVLVATLLEAIGHPTRFVAIKTKPFGPYVHVFTETKIGPKWVAVETTENWPVGFAPPQQAARMVVNN